MENYKKSGCHECVHADSKWDWINDKFQVIERNCKLGNTDKLIEWWENNSYKKDDFEKMECHEFSEPTKSLVKMNKMASEILNLIREKNNNIHESL